MHVVRLAALEYSALRGETALHPTFVFYNYIFKNLRLDIHVHLASDMTENLTVIWQKAIIALLVAVIVNLLYNFIRFAIRSNHATNKAAERAHKPFVPPRFLTLRISNIPRIVTAASLREILERLPIAAQGIGGQLPCNLLEYSYSPTAVSSFSTRYAVATVTFEHAPATSELEMALKQSIGVAANQLKVDRDFLGITPLSDGDGINVEYVVSSYQQLFSLGARTQHIY